MPNLVTVPSITPDIQTDAFWFNDVSSAPDVLSQAIGSTVRQAFNPGTLFVDDYANPQGALTAFVNSTSHNTLVFPSSGFYTVSVTLSVSDLVGKTIDGNGATISLVGEGAQYGIEVTGTCSNSFIKNLNFTGNAAGNQYGIRLNTTGNILTYNNLTISECSFGGSLVFGLKTEAGTSGATIRNCNFNGTNIGQVALWLAGEYCIATENFIFGTPTGIYDTGGNNRVINNTVVKCNQGIVIQAAVDNSDHGTCSFNTVNHCLAVGIWIASTAFSMDAIGNQIWATAGGTFGAAPLDTSFGMFIQSATNVNVRNNTFGRNTFSLGYKDCTDCNFKDNDFIGVSPPTTNHIKNFGGTNARNTISDNTIDDLVAVDAVIDPEATMYKNRIAGSLNEYGYVANNLTNSTVTGANITGLVFQRLLAGRTYTIQAIVKCQNSTPDEGLQMDFNGGTCTATFVSGSAVITLGGTSVVSNILLTSLADVLLWGTITGETWITITVTITVNAKGSLQMRFAEGNAHVTGTATIFKGSSIKLTDVTAP